MLIRRMTRFVSVCLLIGMTAWTSRMSTALAQQPQEAAPQQPPRSGKSCLSLIPADAWGFAVVTSIDQLDQKGMMLSQQFQVPIPPLKVLLMAVPGVTMHLDSSRNLCIIAPDFSKHGPTGVVVAIPSRDSSAMVKQFATTQPADGIHPSSFEGTDFFSAVHEDWILVSQAREPLADIMKTGKKLHEGLAPPRAKALEECDVYVGLAMGRILSTYKDMIMMGLGPMAAAGGPEGIESIEKLLKLMMEVEWLDIGLRIDQQDVRLMMIVTPKTGSDLEKMIKDGRNSEQSLLAALPKEPYLIAAGGTTNFTENAEKFAGSKPFSQMTAQIPDKNLEACKTLDAEYLNLVKGLTKISVSVSLQAEGGNSGLFYLTKVLEVRDSTAMMRSIRNFYKAVTTLSTNPDFTRAMQALEHTADGETIGGKKVDTLRVKLANIAEWAKITEDDLGKISKLFGEELVFRFGAVDGTRIVGTFGGGTQRFEQVVRNCNKSDNPLSADAGIQSVSARLPAPRQQEMYIAADNILHAVTRVARVVNEEFKMPFVTPTLDAPLAVGSVVHGSVSRTDMVIPMKLILAVKDMVMQYQESERKREMAEMERMEPTEPVAEPEDGDAGEAGDDFDDGEE